MSTSDPHSPPIPPQFLTRLGALAQSLGALMSSLMSTLPRPPRASTMQQGGRNDGPPDLDELWRDFNRKLSGLFGGKGGKGGGSDRDP